MNNGVTWIKSIYLFLLVFKIFQFMQRSRAELEFEFLTACRNNYCIISIALKLNDIVISLFH